MMLFPVNLWRQTHKEDPNYMLGGIFQNITEDLPFLCKRQISELILLQDVSLQEHTISNLVASLSLSLSFTDTNTPFSLLSHLISAIIFSFAMLPNIISCSFCSLNSIYYIPRYLISGYLFFPPWSSINSLLYQSWVFRMLNVEHHPFPPFLSRSFFLLPLHITERPSCTFWSCIPHFFKCWKKMAWSETTWAVYRCFDQEYSSSHRQPQGASFSKQASTGLPS